MNEDPNEPPPQQYGPPAHVPTQDTRIDHIRHLLTTTEGRHQNAETENLECWLIHDFISGHHKQAHQFEKYGYLFNASPVNPGPVTARQYLQSLFNPGEAIAVLQPRAVQAKITAAESACNGLELPAAFYPFPLNANLQGTEFKLTARISSKITDWRYAVTELDGRSGVEGLFLDIRDGFIPTAAVISGPADFSQLLFRVDARNQQEWEQRVEQISGRANHWEHIMRPFSVRNKAWIPSASPDRRLVYFNPGVRWNGINVVEYW